MKVIIKNQEKEFNKCVESETKFVSYINSISRNFRSFMQNDQVLEEQEIKDIYSVFQSDIEFAKILLDKIENENFDLIGCLLKNKVSNEEAEKFMNTISERQLLDDTMSEDDVNDEDYLPF